MEKRDMSEFVTFDDLRKFALLQKRADNNMPSSLDIHVEILSTKYEEEKRSLVRAHELAIEDLELRKKKEVSRLFREYVRLRVE